MPVKKKAAPAKKAAPQKTVKNPKTPVAKKATRSRKIINEGPPPSSLPPAVLVPPPVKKAPRKAPAPPAEQTPGTELARAVAQAADIKKGEHIVILDVRGLSMVTDFFVITSGSSMPHLRAIRNEIAERIHEEREEKPHSSQGMAESHWMLLDYGDVVVHIFLAEKRALYALEELWGDAPRLDWTPT